MKAKLVLENGTIFEGSSFGAETEICGEVVFNTSMSGYQEILTDPSYAGQIVTMTYPLIGNYGVNLDDMESAHAFAAGFVVKEYSGIPSNHRSVEPLGEWLKRQKIPAIEGLDTRMLTKILRTSGAMRGILSTGDLDDARLLRKVKDSPMMEGLDLTGQVTCKSSYEWDQVDTTPFALKPQAKEARRNGERFRVIVYDYGLKRNIVRRLAAYGCAITVVPSAFPAEEVLRLDPDGIFLSNGPGDPAAARYAIETIKKLLDKKPIFGICLGHQLLALALGGKTFKLKFGHRGANHPVKNLLTNEIEITSQNHGFAVDPDSLGSEIEITHTNLNDGTNEGLRHRELPVFSVQYHPEASPGPHDSDYLFRQFIEMMENVSVPKS
ncbi:MAG TPA: glutamine-hydrolyzing carbamoyl-phosphate synthase small subunit [Bacteroidota bacterium]|nr:glutamine-hydrolyzing carbamoyl-phosphate synthase small subunit [Bacteroidota bacterium]